MFFSESQQRFLLFWHHPILQPSFNLSETVHERVDMSIKLFSLK